MCKKIDYFSARDLLFKYHIELSIDKYEKLAKYAELMIQESEYQNITAIRNDQDIWIRHFLDSLYLCKYFPTGSFSLIDIGTGGGIPGIPLSIMLDQANITLLDSELRKIEFCQRCAKELQLNIHCISGRAEEFAKMSVYRGQFDYAVSRAMTSGSILCELSLPYLRINGTLFAMKGKHFDDQIERFQPAVEKLHSEIVLVDHYTLEGEKKNLIIVKKTDVTPDEFPRRFAKIKRQPL